jgi:hypothetical protein
MVKGAVPGSKGGWIMVRDAVKKSRHPTADARRSSRAGWRRCGHAS